MALFGNCSCNGCPYRNVARRNRMAPSRCGGNRPVPLPEAAAATAGAVAGAQAGAAAGAAAANQAGAGQCPYPTPAQELYGVTPVLETVETCCDARCGCRTFPGSARDRYWPGFAHPRWLSCDALYRCPRR